MRVARYQPKLALPYACHRTLNTRKPIAEQHSGARHWPGCEHTGRTGQGPSEAQILRHTWPHAGEFPFRNPSVNVGQSLHENSDHYCTVARRMAVDVHVATDHFSPRRTIASFVPSRSGRSQGGVFRTSAITTA